MMDQAQLHETVAMMRYEYNPAVRYRLTKHVRGRP
jgi:hypothetical protein